MIIYASLKALIQAKPETFINHILSLFALPLAENQNSAFLSIETIASNLTVVVNNIHDFIYVVFGKATCCYVIHISQWHTWCRIDLTTRS